MDGSTQLWTVVTFAKVINGVVVGDEGTAITGLGGIDTAEEGDLVFAESRKYVEAAVKSRCAAIITKKEFAEGVSKPVILVEEPRLAFLTALEFVAPPVIREASLHPTAVVDSTAELGENVSVGAHVSIGAGTKIGNGVILMPGVRIGAGCTIGDDTILNPNVVLYSGVSVGRRCLIHAGAVIGSDGFGFMPVGRGLKKVPHIGSVRIEDEVEIGANCCIDRAKTAETVIGAGTKLDNLVHIGHNVQIGRSCLLLAQVVIGGTTRLGDGVILAGAAVVSDHINIGSGALVGGNSGVRYDVPAGGRVYGTPAVPLNQRLREVSFGAKLPEMAKQIKALQARLAELEGKSGSDADEKLTDEPA